MVHIKFGVGGDAVIDASLQFDVWYKYIWFNDPFVVKMVEDVDKVKMLGPGIFKSILSPQLSAKRLSAGAKLLVLLYYHPECDYYATNCGDNCAKWILEIGKMHDVSIALTRVMNFGDDFVIDYNGAEITSMDEYIKYFREDYCDKFFH